MNFFATTPLHIAYLEFHLSACLSFFKNLLCSLPTRKILVCFSNQNRQEKETFSKVARVKVL
jgi:hypothetical protein